MRSLTPAELAPLPFKVGESVRLKVATSGDDHRDNERHLPPGKIGRIDSIDHYGEDQGIGYTVVIPATPKGFYSIVNVFDEGDGPITDFFEALS